MQKTTLVIQLIRRALYAPLDVVNYLPGGAPSNLALLRFLTSLIAWLDMPLLRLKGWIYAKST